jgi:hypothetical protein
VRAIAGSDFCFAHDPEKAIEREAARLRGGQNRSNVRRLRGLMPPRLVGVFDTLETALEQVHAGDLEPKQAQAMASLARAMVAVLSAGEMEERMRQIEARLG